MNPLSFTLLFQGQFYCSGSSSVIVHSFYAFVTPYPVSMPTSPTPYSSFFLPLILQ
jgi:hypothetical protein